MGVRYSLFLLSLGLGAWIFPGAWGLGLGSSAPPPCEKRNFTECSRMLIHSRRRLGWHSGRRFGIAAGHELIIFPAPFGVSLSLCKESSGVLRFAFCQHFEPVF